MAQAPGRSGLPAGDLSTIDYSDSTPDVSFTYDRRGRRQTVAQAGGATTTFAYNNQNQVGPDGVEGALTDWPSV